MLLSAAVFVRKSKVAQFLVFPRFQRRLKPALRLKVLEAWQPAAADPSCSGNMLREKASSVVQYQQHAFSG